MALIGNITTDNRSEDKPFPKLMKHRDGTIVLFVDGDTGIVVFSTLSPSYIGKYVKDWGRYDFSDYTGTVTLSNE